MEGRVLTPLEWSVELLKKRRKRIQTQVNVRRGGYFKSATLYPRNEDIEKRNTIALIINDNALCLIA